MSIINIENGTFSISEKLIIERKCLYSAILLLVPQNRTWDIGNGYKWIYFENILIEELFFNIGLCFKNEKLKLIDFTFHSEKVESLSWKEWSEETELDLKNMYDNWLTAEIGSKRAFNWGNISAYYDPRGGQASIAINYI